MTARVDQSERPHGALYLDDLEVGMTWVTRGRTITETDLVTYGSWSWDTHPLHFDEEYSKRTQFGGRIFQGPGALAVAFGLEMTLGWKMGTVLAFLGIREWEMLAPVRIGDTIRVREEVTEVRPSRSKSDRGVVTTRVEIVNQDDVVCQSGFWLVLSSRSPAENTPR
ncbi:MaoC/PaaZ C-terminal domain-containing protein [Saccharopolyspora mangrovi]|uniref:MaoC/PaaZ C-terminal domain-containing protein n=1 Tax=Saccharopolyspora mangrovi TaxID=3082379 RepID=A0ABU6AG34_9PSEU|nr:MaoC/PaaZ C-terminal domain-containing protein [Saccharopolyspora sp. S2-29]MEB3370524.1 MaoC/PaaZ C-terminal domain-containing protein [Saccharopolyspora sp. S2-29]